MNQDDEDDENEEDEGAYLIMQILHEF